MGGKYASPEVSFRDVAAALPQLPHPLLWRLSLYPRPQNTTTLSPCVELVYVLPNGATVSFKRWGGTGRSTNTREVLSSLLVAAQEAHMYVGRSDPTDLLVRVAWDLGIPIQG